MNDLQLMERTMIGHWYDSAVADLDAMHTPLNSPVTIRRHPPIKGKTHPVRTVTINF